MASDEELLSGSMKDLEWFRVNSNEIVEEHGGEVVAVKDKEIIAFAQNSKILLEQLSGRGIDYAEVIIEYVPKKDEIVVL
jgi:N-dimethylarginine dimethylaminohydrolase